MNAARRIHAWLAQSAAEPRPSLRETNLAQLINRLRADELQTICERAGLVVDPDLGQRRLAIWHWGAAHEARSSAWLGTAVQPEPRLLANKLVMLAPPTGRHSPSAGFPRALPPSRAPQFPEAEPDSVDELLDCAERALGVRLGPRGADKGAWGNRAAMLLGIEERGDDEPDWRGDVEIKTVPVTLHRDGYWRIAEDPAICMASPTARPYAKLQRVLWLFRASVPPNDATLVAWYYMETTPALTRLLARDLHLRPKGPKGTSAKGYYLHKRFFADAGMLAVLNGASVYRAAARSA